METLGPLNYTERQVVTWMRKLAQVSREWSLKTSTHQRKEGDSMHLEATVFVKIPLKPDQFLAVE